MSAEAEQGARRAAVSSRPTFHMTTGAGRSRTTRRWEFFGLIGSLVLLFHSRLLLLKDRLYVNEAHRLAATNLAVPASTIVTQARHGKDDDFRERSPHEESDAQKLNRRRFDGTLAKMNDKDFHDCEIHPTCSTTISGEKYLFKDVMHGGFPPRESRSTSAVLAPSVQATPAHSYSSHPPACVC